MFSVSGTETKIFCFEYAQNRHGIYAVHDESLKEIAGAYALGVNVDSGNRIVLIDNSVVVFNSDWEGNIRYKILGII